MTKLNTNWRNAKLPENIAVFAVGDIHGHHELLKPLLAAIEQKIDSLPPGTKAEVIGIGDYIDRGPSGPQTIDMLVDFRERMQAKLNVEVKYLCGNHDEFFKRLLEAKEIIDHPIGDPKNKLDYSHVCTNPDGNMYLRGLESWMFSGGGLSTIKDYIPELDAALIDFENKCFKRDANFSMDKVNAIIKTLQARVPQSHKDFFNNTYENNQVILGDYLFTHAGVDPNQPLQDQGLGPNAKYPEGGKYIDALMLRDPFLWRNDDNLPNCDYVVVHGHTPSAIEDNGNIIADGQKNYRLCIDTAVNGNNGSLTCFMRHGNQASFMAVNKSSPDKVNEYSIPEVGQHVAEAQHRKKFPEYHSPAPI